MLVIGLTGNQKITAMALPDRVPRARPGHWGPRSKRRTVRDDFPGIQRSSVCISTSWSRKGLFIETIDVEHVPKTTVRIFADKKHKDLVALNVRHKPTQPRLD